ncbi:MAG: hypothetical protein R3F60_04105 [bacterium]
MRTHCRFPDVMAELGCNDDVNPLRMDRNAQLDLDLPAGEPAFIFVDGYDNGDPEVIPWRGPYTLTVQRQP